MSDLDFDSDSDQEVSENHSKFVDAVRQLDKGQRVRKPERSEPSLEVSEYHLVKSGITDADAVQIENLTKTLGKKGHHADLSKKINATKNKAKLLPKPLEKPEAQRIKRTVGFENTKKELGKWTGIIARNRTAASISFPLSQTSMKLQPADQYVKQFRLKSDLEKELEALEPEKALEDEKDKFELTLEEILERRKEAAKFRAQQSYKEAKAHRQNKIKSKKFHRIQRKERIKKALKEFEELQKTDPQAALEKLDQLDKTRAQERVTLRHKSTGQWAKSKQVRAKYDKESRQMLAEQLAISRELTQKVKKDDDSDEDDDQEQPLQLSKSDKENPWLHGVKTESEIDQFIGEYRKYWNEKNKLENNQNDNKDDNVEEKQKVFEESEIVNFSKSNNPVEEVIEEFLPEQNNFNGFNNSDERKSINKNSSKNDTKQKKKLQKSSKDKLGIKLPKTKLSKTTKLNITGGTSNWCISSIEPDPKNKTNNLKDMDIDDMFDSIDDKLQEKINRKLKKVTNMLKAETRKERRKSNKKKKNDEEVNDIEQLGLKGQQTTKPIIDKPIEETINSQPSENSQTDNIQKISNLNNSGKSTKKITEIDPNKFINMKPKLVKTLLPDEVVGEDVLDDSDSVEEDQHQIISEAFADDDVVDEFRKEKDEEIKKSQPEDVDLRLPGWGSWGGKDLKLPSRKRRRFILHAPKPPPRRDENKGDVVIIEEKCPRIKRHLVNELPFPFNSVQDFEASIRAPIGRDFVPEKTFSKLIQPHVKTMMGKVIEPMSEDFLVKRKAVDDLPKPDGNLKKKDKSREKKRPRKSLSS